MEGYTKNLALLTATRTRHLDDNSMLKALHRTIMALVSATDSPGFGGEASCPLDRGYHAHEQCRERSRGTLDLYPEDALRLIPPGHMPRRTPA
jgi:hypothetical protein